MMDDQEQLSEELKNKIANLPAEPGQRIKLPKSYPLKRPDLENQDRLTMTLGIAHEHAGDQPYQIQQTAWRMLDTQEEVYSRRVVVSEEITKLDLGWFSNKPESIGVITVENLTGRGHQLNPTKETREAEANQIVVLYHEDYPGFQYKIRPGWIHIGESNSVEKLRLQCPTLGKATCRITIFPR